MKQCNQCGNMLANDATYCYACNTPQTEGFEDLELKPQYNDTFLKVLCGLTIAGCVISILSSTFSLISGSAFPIEGIGILTGISFLVAIAKLTGAILMLKKKLLGLYIYSAAAVVGMIVQCYAVSLTRDYAESMAQGSGIVVVVSTALGVLIVITFLILYWMPTNRRLLS